MKTISIFGQKFHTISFIVVLSCVATLLYLGTWQLERRKEKLNFIDQINRNITNPPVKLDSRLRGNDSNGALNDSNGAVNDNNPSPVSSPDFSGLSIPLYTKIELSGHFLDDQKIFLYGRRSAYPEKDGYYFLSPFQDRLGNTYLVSRGWVPQSAKKNLESFKSNSDSTITAFVMPGEKKSFFTPDNDLKNNIWFTLDLMQAKAEFQLSSNHFYLMQIDNHDLPEGAFSLTSKYLNVVRNDHLEYAITWYSLAGFLCLIYFIFNKRRGDHPIP